MKVRVSMLAFVGLSVAAVSAVTTWRAYGDAPMIAMTAETLERQVNRPDMPLTKMVAAYRNDGSSVWITHVVRPDRQISERRDLVDAKKYKRVIIDEATESLTTHRIPENINLSARARNCTLDKTAERSKLMGYDVILKVSEDGRLRHESWLAPSLNCLTLKQVVTKRENGVTTELLHREVTRITLGEPDAALFNVPSSYVERTPAEFRAEAARRFNLEFPATQDTAQHDQHYQDNK